MFYWQWNYVLANWSEIELMAVHRVQKPPHLTVWNSRLYTQCYKIFLLLTARISPLRIKERATLFLILLFLKNRDRTFHKIWHMSWTISKFISYWNTIWDAYKHPSIISLIPARKANTPFAKEAISALEVGGA